jgi:hypothetical protein
MPHYTEYRCSDCGKYFSQAEAHDGKLVRKMIQFQTIGPRPKVLRSRTTKWMCASECLTADVEYNLESFRSPGQLSDGLERVRAATGTTP